jgi:hypothetical protein
VLAVDGFPGVEDVVAETCQDLEEVVVGDDVLVLLFVLLHPLSLLLCLEVL